MKSSPISLNAFDIFLQGLCLFIAGATGMLLPLLVVNSGSSKAALFLAFGNAFSGGVMLAAGLVHMLSNALLLYPDQPKIPLIICFIGILIPFAIEKGGLLWFLISHNKENQERRRNLTENKGLLDSQLETQAEDDQQNPTVYYDKNPCNMPGMLSTNLQVRLEFLREASNSSLDIIDHAPSIIPKSTNHVQMLTDDDEIFAETHSLRNTRHTHFSTTWILLTVILVFHSLLAGFTLGIQPPEGTAAIFFALLLHKIFESVAMGIASTQASNASNFMRKTQFLTYCLAAPVGIGMGRAFNESTDAPTPGTTALITALTSGSFIYISLVEITQEEFMNEKNRVEKFIAFCFGSLVMIILV